MTSLITALSVAKPTGVLKMYQVEYAYYNYPRKAKSFETYKAARGFFNRIRRATGVKVAELKCPVTNPDIILDPSKPAYIVER